MWYTEDTSCRRLVYSSVESFVKKHIHNLYLSVCFAGPSPKTETDSC